MSGKSRWLRAVLVLTLILAFMAVGSADYVDGIEKDSHKIVTKHDHSGTFTGHHGAYNWGGFSSAETVWTFKVHAKQAMLQELSKGTVHFYGENPDGSYVDVVGQVKYADVDYPYWAGRPDVLLLAGTTSYNDTNYYFMYLESELTVWLALSTHDYSGYVDANTVFPGSYRAYQVHSNLVTDQFDLPEKVIR